MYREYLASLEAGLFNRAHAIVLDRLASEAILREDVAVLQRLLDKLQDEAVDDWERGGGVSGHPPAKNAQLISLFRFSSITRKHQKWHLEY